MGIFLPYFNLYCYHLKFTGFEIGLLSSVRSLIMVIMPLFWGAVADYYKNRRFIYIFCNFMGTAFFVFYIYITNFWGMLIITLLYSIFWAPIISFMEAFSMDILGSDKESYGKIRVWGTISFIITVISLGKIIDLYSIKIIIILIFAGSFLQLIFSNFMPEAAGPEKTSYLQALQSLLKARVIIFLLSSFLMLVSHSTYYGFASIHLENLGFDNTFIGIYWAAGSIAEMFVMINSQQILKRFSIEKILIFSFAIAVLRWTVLFFARSGILILLTQLTHAVTYAAFHIASIIYIDYLTPKELKTLGQSVNNAVSYGLGLMVGLFLNGCLFEIIGTFNLFLVSGIIAFTGGMMLFIYTMSLGTR
ncbi:MFS transporter, PPP family, 3-phenylpropionic acid transporter [Candidatus Magnetomoraceae bacterium gMMP-15]